MSRTIFHKGAALGARGVLVLTATAVLALAMSAAWAASDATARPTAGPAGSPAAGSCTSITGICVTVTSHFVWTPGSANTSGEFAFIDNGATNHQPGDLLFVTPNYDAGGVGAGKLEPGAIGVVYWFTDHWAIFREDQSAMPAGLSFNVLAVPPNRVGKSAFVHTAGPYPNTGGNHTFISSPLINGKPNALIQVTQVYYPGGKRPTFNPHAVGVVYDPVNKRWAIFNEDNAPMPVGASFNVLIGSAPSNGGHAVLLTTTRSNQKGDLTFISNAQTNGDPNNITFVTQNWNPGGGDAGTYNNAQIGVLYVGSEEGVFEEDLATMPLHAAFNLLIFSG
jgi:hypothetical protein